MFNICYIYIYVQNRPKRVVPNVKPSQSEIRVIIQNQIKSHQFEAT